MYPDQHKKEGKWSTKDSSPGWHPDWTWREEQTGLAPKDLAPYIGGRNRVYEVLNRKRPLSLKMIWRPKTRSL